MTTPATGTSPYGDPGAAVLDVSGTTRVPFTRHVLVEMRKMFDTRAGKWLLITIVAITALVVALLLVFGSEGDKTFEQFLGGTAGPQGFLLPVLGVLLVTSEWGQRAALTTFTLEPHRERVIAAKLVAAVLFGLAAIAVAIVVAAAATLVANVEDMWGVYGFGDLGNFALLQTMGIVQGLAFGMLFLNSAAAIVTYFVLPIAFNILTSIIEQVRDIQPWIDIGTAQSPLFGGEALTAEEWAQVGTTSLIWIGIPMAVGAWRMLHAEVK